MKRVVRIDTLSIAVLIFYAYSQTGLSQSTLLINSDEEQPSAEGESEGGKEPHPFAFDGGDALENAKEDEKDGLDRFNVKSEREGARGESEVWQPPPIHPTRTHGCLDAAAS